MTENYEGPGGSSFGAWLSGFILGTVIGGAAALLAAPQTGEMTRQLIRDKSTEFKEKAKGTVEDTRAKAEQKLAETRARAAEVIKETSSQAEELARLAKERADEVARRSQAELEQQRTPSE